MVRIRTKEDTSRLCELVVAEEEEQAKRMLEFLSHCRLETKYFTQK